MTKPVFIPLETTAATADEKESANWIEEKEKFTAKTKITIKFGPMEWPDLQTTTEMPPIDQVTQADSEIDSQVQTEETQTKSQGEFI